MTNKVQDTKQIQVTDRILITANEAATLLTIGRSTFWAYVAKGKLPQPVKIGGLTRWRVADLQRHFASPDQTQRDE